MRWPCVCCGYFTLPEPTGDSDEICPVCFWQDDHVDNRNTDVLGPNNLMLAVARERYVRLGAHEERWLSDVRRATRTSSRRTRVSPIPPKEWPRPRASSARGG